jgi:hypothetical protein
MLSHHISPCECQHNIFHLTKFYLEKSVTSRGVSINMLGLLTNVEQLAERELPGET